MLAATAFEHHATALDDQLKEAQSADEAVRACVMAIEKTACELAQCEEDERARQRQQAAMALIKNAPRLMLCTKARVKWSPFNLSTYLAWLEPEYWRKPNWPLVAGLAILAVLWVFMGLREDLRPLVLLNIAGTLLACLGVLRAKPRKEEPVAQGNLTVDAKATLRRMRELMRAVDVCTGDLALIAQEGGVRIAGDADEATLDLLLSLMEASAAGREGASAQGLRQVEQYLYAMGIEVVYFDEAHAALFDQLPTRGQTRTIRPALLREGEVIRRGVAASREVLGA